MDLVRRLESQSGQLVDETMAAMARVPLHHYEAKGEEVTRDYVSTLLDRLVTCLGDNSLLPMVEHAELIAGERFHAGFGLSEIQTAFNALEEAIWRFLVTQTPGDDVLEWLAKVGAVLGTGKDTLARTYVDLASHHHTHALNEKALLQVHDPTFDARAEPTV
jgi:hypothetical protein